MQENQIYGDRVRIRIHPIYLSLKVEFPTLNYLKKQL